MSSKIFITRNLCKLMLTKSTVKLKYFEKTLQILTH